MDFVTRKKSPIVTLIEFQRHVAPRQHALTSGHKEGAMATRPPGDQESRRVAISDAAGRFLPARALTE
jgi:hypothetical protein